MKTYTQLKYILTCLFYICKIEEVRENQDVFFDIYIEEFALETAHLYNIIDFILNYWKGVCIDNIVIEENKIRLCFYETTLFDIL